MIKFCRADVLSRVPVLDKKKTVFLSFDDGPDPKSTPAILELLDKYQAKATFFVVGKKVEDNPHVLAQTRECGHSIGNHSYDHRTWHYLRGTASLREWVEGAERAVKEVIGEETIGFRPPVGIVTPPLYRVLQDKKLPLIGWSMRFYDAVRTLSRQQVDQALERMVGGSIVLLHDYQIESRRAVFLDRVNYFLAGLVDSGWSLQALPGRERLLWMSDPG